LSSASEHDREVERTIAPRVCSIVAETQMVPLADVRPELELEDDLGVDSLAMIRIAVAAEEAFGCHASEVDQLDEGAIVTVRDLIDFVAAEVGAQAKVPR
jgi:acyl carrier protein